MKKQYLPGSFIISALLIAPVLASAATADEIRAQIQSLLSQITALQAQLDNLTSDTSVTTTTSASCPNLYRPLYRGVRGNDVVSLQQFLRSTGDFTYPEITDYYGPVTERAVQSWQARNGVVSSGNAESTGYGVVGTQTRAAIAARCGISKQPVIQTCPQVTIPQCANGTLVSLGTNSNGCSLGYSCKISTTTVCPKISIPQCTNGTLSSLGTDQNGCSLGYQCKLSTVCPVYNACPAGYTTNTSTDASECTKISCIPVLRPSASLTASPTSGTAPLSVTFAVPDTCAQGLASENVRRIDFGDGKTESVSECAAQSVTHSYQSAGSYTASLQSAGYGPAPLTWATQSSVTVTVSGAVSSTPKLQLSQPSGGEEFSSGSTMTVRWSTSGLPNDIASRHPRLSFRLSDFNSDGNYGAYTGANKQANGVGLGDEITDVAKVLGGSANIPITLHYASPNKFARGFLQATLSYDRQTAAQAASAILATSPMSAFIELYDTTDSEITISFPTGTSQNACFDDYQSWDLGGTWFAHGERRSSMCLVGGPGSGTIDWSCQRPNICYNGTWRTEQ